MDNKVLLVKIYVFGLEKNMYFITDESDLKEDDLAIVETSRGTELGRVQSRQLKISIYIQSMLKEVLL